MSFFIKNFFFASEPKVDFYDSLQEMIASKNDYCNSIMNYLYNLTNCLSDFQIRIKNISLNLENIEVSPEEKNIHNLIESINKEILAKFEESNKTLNEIYSLFEKYEANMKQEIKIYKEYKDTFNELYKKKKKLEQSKQIYHNTGKQMEYKVIQFVKNNYLTLDQINQNEFLMEELDQITYPPHISYEAYEKDLNVTNNLIEIYTQKQNKFFNFLPEIIAKDDVFYFNLVNTYVNLLENEEKKLGDEINRLKDNKNFEKKESKSELKKLVENYEKNKIEENKIKFEQYPTKIELNDCKYKKEFEIYFESINIIKKYVDRKIFPDYNYDIELKNFKMNELIKDLFSNKREEINQSIKDTFLDLLEEPSVYHTFFVILSKLRSNGSFSQPKSLIDLLGQGFEIILSKSKKNKLYDNVKNCIILSQTYYYEDDKKEKIYIFESIKNNKWLKTPKFWRNFILYLTEKDLGRFDLKKEKDFQKLGEVVFSNLLTFASNMKNFEIDKRIIVKIIDEFLEKYNYMSENNKKLIYEMIIQEKEGEVINSEEELEKLRKEYDISLEKNNNDETDKEIKEENKEEIEEKNKEEIEEENKKENKEENKENKEENK